MWARAISLGTDRGWRTFFWLCGCGERPGAGSDFRRSLSRIRGRGSPLAVSRVQAGARGSPSTALDPVVVLGARLDQLDQKWSFTLKLYRVIAPAFVTAKLKSVTFSLVRQFLSSR